MPMLALVLMMQSPLDVPDMVATAHDRLTADRRCARPADSGDITVCALRQADRYRVPFIVHDPGDPRYQSVREERERLLHRTTPIQDLSPFLVGGGMVGVGTTVRQGGGATVRPLAP